MCDLYTLYPPGLTVIIYEGFRHTRVRTLFKAQIYLNKNKNKAYYKYALSSYRPPHLTLNTTLKSP